MSCSHLQKDPEERHHLSGYRNCTLLIICSLRICLFTVFDLLCCYSVSLPCSWCFVWAWASSWSAPLPPSRSQPGAPGSKSKLLLLQHLTRTTCHYRTSLSCTVKIMTCTNGWHSPPPPRWTVYESGLLMSHGNIYLNRPEPRLSAVSEIGHQCYM